jgi:hypothetical protein
MVTPLDPRIAAVAAQLREKLGENLFSCCLYGSAVRGNAVQGVSDLNLLIVLSTSSATAHQAIAGILSHFADVDPFVVAKTGLERTARCFATKFASIQRNYHVLHGADPFAGMTIDPSLERLMCEQALRNVRLRSTYAFIMHGRQRNYAQFLAESVSALFVQLSDVVRLSGHELPRDFRARIPIMVRLWSIDAAILEDLLALREKRRAPSGSEIADWHARLLAVLDAALQWIEQNWGEASGSAKA